MKFVIESIGTLFMIIGLLFLFLMKYSLLHKKKKKKSIYEFKI